MYILKYYIVDRISFTLSGCTDKLLYACNLYMELVGISSRS